MIIIKILVFVIVLSVIIVIHELGHFLTAKKFGILCHEFSLGMGPAIYKKKKGETTYSIRCLPIGGFVSMAGEQFTEDIIKPGDPIGLNIKDGSVYELVLDDKTECDLRAKVISRNIYARNGEPLEIEVTDDMNAEIEGLSGTVYPILEDAFYVDGSTRLQIAPYNRCIESKPLWQRFVTIFAGPFMNFVLAMVIYIICMLVQGTPNSKSNIIGKTDESYYAYSQVQKGDAIKSVNGISVTSWKSFQDVMKDEAYSGNYELTVVLENNGVERTEVISPNVSINSIGISNHSIKSDYKDLGITGAQVGNVSLRYKGDSPSKNAVKISNGDVITAINIYNHGASYNEAEWVNVTSWSDLCSAFASLDVSNVYFKYYDAETGEYHSTYDDKQLAETYGNEVLDNQRIPKIKLYLGVSPVKHHNFFDAIGAAGKEFWQDFTLIFRTLKLLIHPSGVRQVGVENLSGVIGIYNLIGSYMSAGIIALLLFMALLSVNIGVMNLLPIPVLDGGRILFILIEAITRKPLNRKVEALINNVMFILLMGFMIFIAYNDILRIVK